MLLPPFLKKKLPASLGCSIAGHFNSGRWVKTEEVTVGTVMARLVTARPLNKQHSGSELGRRSRFWMLCRPTLLINPLHLLTVLKPIEI
jgi:hypothetical protein